MHHKQRSKKRNIPRWLLRQNLVIRFWIRYAFLLGSRVESRETFLISDSSSFWFIRKISFQPGLKVLTLVQAVMDISAQNNVWHMRKRSSICDFHNLRSKKQELSSFPNISNLLSYETQTIEISSKRIQINSTKTNKCMSTNLVKYSLLMLQSVKIQKFFPTIHQATHWTLCFPLPASSVHQFILLILSKSRGYPGHHWLEHLCASSTKYTTYNFTLLLHRKRSIK